MSQLLKSQKALSSTVAAIILIAVTVAVSIAICAWIGALTFTWTEKEEGHGIFVGKLTAYEYWEDSPEFITLHFGSAIWFYKGNMNFEVGMVYKIHYTIGASYVDNVTELNSE